MEPVVSESTYVTTTLTRAAYDGSNLIAVMEIAVKTGALEEAGIEIIPDTGGYLSVCPRFETISCGEEEWEAFWTRLPEDKYVENMSMVTAFSIGDISAPGGRTSGDGSQLPATGKRLVFRAGRRGDQRRTSDRISQSHYAFRRKSALILSCLRKYRIYARGRRGGTYSYRRGRISENRKMSPVESVFGQPVL